MKLHYSPGACSMFPHIILNETKTAYEPVKVDLKDKKTASGGDYLKVNSKGSVPALQLADGAVLTEAGVIAQYIADKAGSPLIAAAGSMERYRQVEWLNYISSELHKSIGSLFNPELAAKAGDVIKGRVAKQLTWLNQELANKDFLMGKDYSVPDAYAFTVLGWTKMVGIDLAAYPNVGKYLGRIAARPAVQTTLKAEGLA